MYNQGEIVLIPVPFSDLPKPSVIRGDKIYTLDQSIVIKCIGQVTGTLLGAVRADIIKHIT